jgi:all-trans-retinol 13,14-reductase
MLNIVLKENTFHYRNRNIYHLETCESWNVEAQKEETWPNYMGIFLKAQKNNSKFAASLSVMCYMDWKEIENWKETFKTIPNHSNYRGMEYEAFKERKSQKILDKLEMLLPGISNKIKSYSASTPLTYRDYLGTPEGSIYGIAMDANQPLKYILSSRQKTKNVFLTGQNLNLHGILGVSISALVTCSEILGKDYLMNKVRNA